MIPVSLPARFLDGSSATLDMPTLFARAHEVVEISGSLTDQVSVLRRILLPIHYLVADSAPSELLAAGRYPDAAPARIRSELGDVLRLDGPRPFMQTRGLVPMNPKNAHRPLALLKAETPKGNNVPLRHRAAVREAWTPEQALVKLCSWLDHTTAGPMPAAANDPRASGGAIRSGTAPGSLANLRVTVPLGRTLFETILINAIPLDVDEECEPNWLRIRKDSFYGRRGYTGLLDRLTWQGRLVELLFNEDGQATGFNATAGDAPLSDDGKTRFEFLRDPHLGYRASKPAAGASVGDLKPIQSAEHRSITDMLGPVLEVRKTEEVTSARPPAALAHVADLIAEGALDEGADLRLVVIETTMGEHSAAVLQSAETALPLRLRLLAESGEDARSALTEAAHAISGASWALGIHQHHIQIASGKGGSPHDWRPVSGQRKDMQGAVAGDLWARRAEQSVLPLLNAVLAHGFDAAMTAWEQSIAKSATAAAAATAATAPLSAVAPGRQVPMKEGRGSGELVRVHVDWADGELRKALKRHLARAYPATPDRHA